MTTADQYRANADNCAVMAEAAETEPNRNRFKRMEAAWRALAEEQDWLDENRRPRGSRANDPPEWALDTGRRKAFARTCGKRRVRNAGCRQVKQNHYRNSGAG